MTYTCVCGERVRHQTRHRADGSRVALWTVRGRIVLACPNCGRSLLAWAMTPVAKSTVADND